QSAAHRASRPCEDHAGRSCRPPQFMSPADSMAGFLSRQVVAVAKDGDSGAKAAGAMPGKPCCSLLYLRIFGWRIGGIYLIPHGRFSPQLGEKCFDIKEAGWTLTPLVLVRIQVP